jgi:crotonobetainyl-CoA:carnitine CoA-transferase CaiB-like acyl-CoA transferase
LSQIHERQNAEETIMNRETEPSPAAPPGGAFGSLKGLRILDLTQMLAGPFTTMMFADHGATVVKVEAPEGDVTRGFGLYRADDHEHLLGGYFQSLCRNKESVALDLKSEAGKEAFRALVRNADAVVENFRAGVMDRLGLSYESLREINPRLVYGTIRGFGDPRTGASPYGAWPAYDVVAQAMGGIMAITGPDAETPMKVGPGIGDIIPGMFLAYGVLAAIYNARLTGRGQFVDVAMADSILSICERAVVQNTVCGLVPTPEGNHHPYLCPFGLYPTQDGPVAIAATNNEFFSVLCKELNAAELLDDARFATGPLRGENKRALIPLISAKTAEFTKAELRDMLGGKIPFGPVMNIAETIADPHFTAREMLVEIEQPGSSPIRVAGVPVKMTETPGGVHRRSPLLGEHTTLRLAEAGLTAAEIAALRQPDGKGTK